MNNPNGQQWNGAAPAVPAWQPSQQGWNQPPPANLPAVQTAGHLLAEAGKLESFMLTKEQGAKFTFDPKASAWLRVFLEENKGVPAINVVEFIQRAQLFGADPRRQQIYLIPRTKK